MSQAKECQKNVVFLVTLALMEGSEVGAARILGQHEITCDAGFHSNQAMDRGVAIQSLATTLSLKHRLGLNIYGAILVIANWTPFDRPVAASWAVWIVFSPSLHVAPRCTALTFFVVFRFSEVTGRIWTNRQYRHANPMRKRPTT